MDIEVEIPGSCGLAFDRRTFDSDGRLTVTDCVISAAQVNPYLGSEIPDGVALGLKPDTMYRLYRDPAALKAAVPALNGKPLLIDHAPVTAADPKQQLIVGAVSECRWSDGKVIGTVSVWDESAICGIQLNVQKDLSAGYRYVARMVPGVTPDGEEFDGRMTSIEFNHVALVVQGRVSGAHVGDSALARARRPVTLLGMIEAERERVLQARAQSPLARLIPGLYRLP